MTNDDAIGKPAPYYDCQDLDKSIAASRASRKLKEKGIRSGSIGSIENEDGSESTSSSQCAEKDQQQV